MSSTDVDTAGAVVDAGRRDGEGRVGGGETDWWEGDPWVEAALGRGVSEEEAWAARRVLERLQRTELRALLGRLSPRAAPASVLELLRVDDAAGSRLSREAHEALWRARATLGGVDAPTLARLQPLLREAEKAVAEDASDSGASYERWSAAATLSGVDESVREQVVEWSTSRAVGEARGADEVGPPVRWFAVVAARARARGWPDERVDEAVGAFRRLLVESMKQRFTADDEPGVAVDRLFRRSWLAMLEADLAPGIEAFEEELAAERRREAWRRRLGSREVPVDPNPPPPEDGVVSGQPRLDNRQPAFGDPSTPDPLTAGTGTPARPSSEVLDEFEWAVLGASERLASRPARWVNEPAAWDAEVDGETGTDSGPQRVTFSALYGGRSTNVNPIILRSALGILMFHRRELRSRIGDPYAREAAVRLETLYSRSLRAAESERYGEPANQLRDLPALAWFTARAAVDAVAPEGVDGTSEGAMFDRAREGLILEASLVYLRATPGYLGGLPAARTAAAAGSAVPAMRRCTTLLTRSGFSGDDPEVTAWLRTLTADLGVGAERSRDLLRSAAERVKANAPEMHRPFLAAVEEFRKAVDPRDA